MLVFACEFFSHPTTRHREALLTFFRWMAETGKGGRCVQIAAGIVVAIASWTQPKPLITVGGRGGWRSWCQKCTHHTHAPHPGYFVSSGEEF